MRPQLLDVPARPLHAGLQQRQRLKHLDKFTECDAGVLVATDVAARGLDIPDVRAVRSRCPPHLAPHARVCKELACSDAAPRNLRLCTTTCRPAWMRTCTAVAAPRALLPTACRCVSLVAAALLMLRFLDVTRVRA